MAIIHDKDSRFKNLEFKAGVMLMVAIVGIVVLVLLLGIERDLFTKKFSLKFVAENGAGINKGMPVKLSGFKIGRVSKVELIEGARVRVTAEVSQKYAEYLRKGIKANITKEGYIGDPYVDITVGDFGATLLADGDSIPYFKKEGMEELINEAKPVMTEIKEIIHYINDPEGDIKVTFGNLKEVSAGLEETRAVITETTRNAGGVLKRVDSLVEKVETRVDPILGSVERVFLRVDGMTVKLGPVIDRLDTVSATLPSTVLKIDSILDDVKLLSAALGTGAPQIMDVIGNTQETVKEGKEIIKGVKASWPVRLMVPKVEKPHLVPLDIFFPQYGAGVGE